MMYSRESFFNLILFFLNIEGRVLVCINIYLYVGHIVPFKMATSVLALVLVKTLCRHALAF